MFRKLNEAQIGVLESRSFTNMYGVPLPVIIGAAMIVLGVVLGIYVAVKAVSRNRDGNDPLV